jgi:hypothetical protein
MAREVYFVFLSVANKKLQMDIIQNLDGVHFFRGDKGLVLLHENFQFT